MSEEIDKALVRRWVEEVINAGDLDAADEIFSPELAADARTWVAPFRESFPDVDMRVVELIAEGSRVVGRFLCSGTHLGEWMGRAPTGRRFEDIDEVYFFTVEGGRIVEFWGLEDTARRLEQLGA